MSGKRNLAIVVVLILGLIIGAMTSPLVAQVIQFEQKALFDDRSDWTAFVGNNDTFDNAVWVVRYNRVAGETWIKDGKKFQVVEPPKDR